MEKFDSDFQTPYTYEVNVSAPTGLGLLYQSGAMKDPRVYYCPSETNYSFMFDPAVAQQYGGWLSIPRATDGGGRTGYNFQIHAVPITPGNPKYKTEFFHATDYTPNAIMGTDLIQGKSFIAHGSAVRPADSKFNIVFIDSHVQTVSGGVTRPLGRNPDGTFHTLATTVITDMSGYAATPAFGTANGTFGAVVWDLEYAAQKN